MDHQMRPSIFGCTPWTLADPINDHVKPIPIPCTYLPEEALLFCAVVATVVRSVPWHPPHHHPSNRFFFKNCHRTEVRCNTACTALSHSLDTVLFPWTAFIVVCLVIGNYILTTSSLATLVSILSVHLEGTSERPCPLPRQQGDYLEFFGHGQTEGDVRKCATRLSVMVGREQICAFIGFCCA